MFYVLAFVVALFFALNIGASGTAASMGPAYGTGAIRRRSVALMLVTGAVFLGAYLGGGNVVMTISDGIIPSHLVSLKVSIIIISGAVITLFLANLFGIPLSTSEVTVGSLVGVGFAYHALYTTKVLELLGIWLTLPFLAYGVSFALGRLIRRAEQLLEPSQHRHRTIKTVLTLLLIAAGCYEAFSAGMNNVANAVGPLVSAGLVEIHTGLFWGALFVALGALVLGGRALETNAKKLANLSLLQGSTASLTSGTLVIAASLIGLPVPLTQMTTMSIMGVGSAKMGIGLWKQGIVKRIMLVWIASPISSLVTSYLFVQSFVNTKALAIVTLCGLAAISVVALLVVHGRRAKQRIQSVQVPQTETESAASTTTPSVASSVASADSSTAIIRSRKSAIR